MLSNLQARSLSAVFVLALLGLAVEAHAGPTPKQVAPPRVFERISPRVRMADRLGAAPSSLRGQFANGTMPVTIRFDHEPTGADVALLERAGVLVMRQDSGAAVGRGRVLAAEVRRGSTAALERVPGIESVELDGPIIPSPVPLDGTTEMTGAQATWRQPTDDKLPLDGTGMTVCDVDSGIDVFHPLFFRADGGVFDWIDTNSNGVFDIGTDQIDVGAGAVVVRSENGVVTPFYEDHPVLNSDAAAFDPKLDFLYADEDGSGVREHGPDAGFTDASPSFGERYLVMDDVDQNGKLDVGEKLFALGTSKIKAFRIDTKTYRRGENLIDAPWDMSFQHGTGASGVMVAGVRGLTGLVGMAPGADVVMATDTKGNRQFQMTSFCIGEGARVVLHEYAPWMGYHLDGSSEVEALIDDSSINDGVAHVNPAGNLSTAKKLYKRTVPSGQTTAIDIQLPAIGATFVGMSLLWLDTSRDLSLLLTAPGGGTYTIDTTSAGDQVELVPGVTLYSYRTDSTRGTARVDFYMVEDQTNGVPVPPGAYTLEVTDPTPPGGADLALVGYIQDEVSGWGTGANFPSFSSEDHLIGWPGTADHGMPISAFTGHDWDGSTPGERAYYSGRGYRIDGEKIMWISGPDNPIVPNHWDSRPLSYIIYGGTSGASPHIAGASALILQDDPSLDGDGVKGKLKEGAMVDDFTGAVPNDDFGWGKLNVYRSIFGADPPGGSAPTIHVDDVEMAIGEAKAAIEVADADEPAANLLIEIDSDYDGQFDETLTQPELSLSYDALGKHVVKLRVTDSTGRTSQTLARIAVVDLPPENPDGTTFSFFAKGGGCTAAGAGDSSQPGGAALLALALAARLRRRRAT